MGPSDEGDHAAVRRARVRRDLPEPVLAARARRGTRRCGRRRPRAVAGAAAHLRTLPSSNGKAASIGYCSGGRQSVLAACNVELDAAVDCYGAYVVGTPAEGFPLKVTNLVDQLPNLHCPLLGLFGNEDQYPSPAQVDELEQILKDHGKPYEFHRYDDAAHAFFAVDRPSYRVAAANDGWERIEAFFTTHLGG